MIITPTQFHFIASFISGILLILVGLAVLSRDKKSAINQLFFAFFILISFYELLTALQVILLNGFKIFIPGTSGPFITSGSFISNVLRSLLTTAFILALVCGATGTLMINYGISEILNRKVLGLGGIVTVILLVVSISHETTIAVSMQKMNTMMTMMGGMMSNAVSRDLFGWIGFYLSIIIFTSIIVIGLGIRIINDSNPVRSKMIRLLVGSIMVISILTLFDIIQVTGQYMDLMLNLGTHALLHIITFAGELLILSAFWSPINVKVPALTIESQPKGIQN